MLPKNTFENKVLFFLFIAFFSFFIFQPALFSPDTHSYLRADITRFPGYIIYLRGLQAVFGEVFSTAAVVGHLVMGFLAIVVFFKNCSRLFSLSVIAQVLLLIVLLFPYFKPIEVALNLTSEGLAYPLYLLLLSFSIDFLLKDQTKKVIYISVVYLLLVLTRGQFIIVGPILGFLFLLKKKRAIRTLKPILIFALLVLLPVISGVVDKTYRYIFYGYAETTPYSYVNAIALPLYVSEANDTKLFDDRAIQEVFDYSYKRLDSLQLLSSEVQGSYHQKYLRFHYHFPEICNQNIHEFGLNYYKENGETPPKNAFAIEAACKVMFPKLVSQHFSEWLTLYYTSIVHGFKSVFVLVFVVVLAFLSLFRVFKHFGNKSAFILLGTLLILSNAMIVAVASHSIMRYLFYNYVIGLLIIILLLKKFIPRHES
ncbi:hypothetical protein G5B37_05775 [Rasiella rasia]|uniref:Glycosyltransferase RgtA/B/C/D-like domain-containing protein n=1 Tax=Rasiella rasia TaxID=2744027 RepID=A0A6G6GKG8_9FLAO|nr:hypothetical protein G5B37_05775 [Rasiella rasia]